MMMIVITVMRWTDADGADSVAVIFVAVLVVDDDDNAVVVLDKVDDNNELQQTSLTKCSIYVHNYD